jgi:hypothetical protein
MELSLKSTILMAGAKDEIPVAACAAVINPVRNCGIIAEDRVQGNVGFIGITKIFCPLIDFLLAG